MRFPCCAIFLAFVVHRRFFRAYRTARLLSYFGHSSSARKLCLQLWVQLRQIALYVLRMQEKRPLVFLSSTVLALSRSLFYIFYLPFFPNVVFLSPLRDFTAACQTYILIRTVIQFSRYTGKISSIYRQREGLFVDPLLEKFLKSGKAPYSGKYREENSCFICFRTQALVNCTAYANKYFCRMQKRSRRIFRWLRLCNCYLFLLLF